MAFVIGVLTAILILDCLLLILLVLMQLPKKEAGAGLAFGGAATDALFGAGSGNFLTKATKYAAVVFFVLAIVLAVMQNHFARRPGSQFLRELERQSQAAPASTPGTTPSTPGPAVTPPAQVIPGTNLPAGGLILPTTSPGTNPAIQPPVILVETNSAAAPAQ